METQKEAVTAIVAGATGMMGRQLVKLLLEHPAYARVIVLVRRDMGISHPKLVQKQVSFDQLEEQLDGTLVKDADVFCTLGTTMGQAGSKAAFRRVDNDYPVALGRAALRHGAASYIVVTAMWSSVRSLMFYTRVKGEAERYLLALGLPRLVFLRPSLLIGDREYEKRLNRLIEIIVESRIRDFDDFKHLLLTELSKLVEHNSLYIRLEAMRTIVLEKNVDAETMLMLKMNLYVQMRRMTTLICEHNALTETEVMDVFQAEASIITGCKLNATLSPEVVDIIEKQGMEGLKRDFKQDVLNTMQSYLEGYRATHRNAVKEHVLDNMLFNNKEETRNL
ncbi:SDR family oxidoreductase [Paenibacillus peoriae]|uniref:SDR family oxidoreductase n=1 Tax=Paenibacillus peoriae TaxID=59893 RepID=UPI00096CD3EF|nr:NAD(P)H-binding protein [Paenibacillus peoriae]OMF45802.1 hypothetical protein BK135_14680 [Paenibacillus peoriae]